jgi:transposase
MSLKNKKKTYKQDWPNYNKAQVEEKERFRELLHDLCRWVEPFPRSKKGGRNPVVASDCAFASTFKVYSTISTRRFSTDLKDAQRMGYVSASLHYNSVCRYLEDERLTPRLHALIALSCRPVRLLETAIAADATGFSSARFRRWFDEKDKAHRSEHDWVKAHIMSGVKTNIVTAAHVETQKAHESPIFKPLLEATIQIFPTIYQVSADKAYSSAENIEAVFYAKAIPYIAFKVNATGGIGGLFEKSFDYYKAQQELFMANYHKRSNVEATFSAIKRKFGDYVRSRSDTAMMNEVLCKILCHNITCLIHSQCELGIEPVFWGDELPGKESAQ